MGTCFLKSRTITALLWMGAPKMGMYFPSIVTLFPCASSLAAWPTPDAASTWPDLAK